MSPPRNNGHTPSSIRWAPLPINWHVGNGPDTTESPTLAEHGAMAAHPRITNTMNPSSRRSLNIPYGQAIVQTRATTYAPPLLARPAPQSHMEKWLGLLPPARNLDPSTIAWFEHDPESINPTLGYEKMEATFQAEVDLMAYRRERTRNGEAWYRSTNEGFKAQIESWKSMVDTRLVDWAARDWTADSVSAQLMVEQELLEEPTNRLIKRVRERAPHVLRDLQEWLDRITVWRREGLQLRDDLREGRYWSLRDRWAGIVGKNLDEAMLDADGTAECLICMQPVVLGDKITELPCKHWFHDGCILRWLREQADCPFCRRRLRTAAVPETDG